MADSDSSAERARLDAIAAVNAYSSGVNAVSMRYSVEVFRRHWRQTRCLELGPAEGVVSALLAEHFTDLTLVDGAERFCTELRARLPQATVICAAFEELEPTQPFDTIVLGHVLEHVDDPVGVLRRVRGWLAPQGVVCAAVPNAMSLHRQAAVLMGLLPDEHALNDADRRHGHRRVYDWAGFRADVVAAGLTIHASGGYWLKPLANAQIEATWTADMVEAFMRLGERHPEIAGEIYVVAGA
ncbi:MAG: class I SAM-dependent methyltransferase [Deltaproteobacteria bacterium]|nr:class I SAM-dependent methyltransferase [Deltaproteobacteria bacterium]